MIDQNQIAQYRSDGVTCLRGVIGQRWIDALREGVEENLRAPGPYAKHYTPQGNPGRFFGDYCNWQRIRQYRDFLLESGVAALAAQLMGSKKVNLYHEHVLVKEPGTLEKTPWHHDQPYYPVDGHQIVSLWIPLDAVSQETCVEYIVGSHRWGKWYAPKRFVDSAEHDGTQSMESIPDEASLRAQYKLVSYALQPGDCIAFHALTLHGAPGNAQPTRRRAFAARFTGDDARFALREGFMSPPPPEKGAPPNGAPMDSDAFPVVYGPESKR
ncbi:MAG: phytanoyl-CoA dioxygenase family protein [Quisquiliibacterium sp.]